MTLRADGALWQHHQRKVNGFRMHYVQAGRGYPLLLLHGWPQSWYEWRMIIPALAEHYTVIAPDLRGLGDSEKPMSGYDKRTLASDVRELVRQLGYEHIGVVGHDWGGSVAYFLANATDKLRIPVMAWGGASFLGDIRSHWQRVAEQVDGGAVAECGHFIPEEQPQFVIDAALGFFAPLAGR